MKTSLLRTLAASCSLCLGAMVCSAATSTTKDSSKHSLEPYMKVGLGMTWHKEFKAKKVSPFASVYTKNKKPNKATSIHFGVGLYANHNLKTDLMIHYSKVAYKSVEKQTTSAFDVMANAYYDFTSHKIIVPYVAAGIGISRNEAGNIVHTNPIGGSTTQIGAVTTNFAWNVGLGVKVNLRQHYALDLGYRYVDLGKVRLKAAPGPDLTWESFPSASQKLRGHQVLLSLIYKF